MVCAARGTENPQLGEQGASGSVGPDSRPRGAGCAAPHPHYPKGTPQARGSRGAVIPDDNYDAIKDVVGVLNVAKGAIHQQLQQHLQGKEAGEDDVADFQGIGELLRLEDRVGHEVAEACP